MTLNYYKGQHAKVGSTVVAASNVVQSDGSFEPDAVTIGTSASMAIDDAHVMPGSRHAIKVATGATASQAYVEFNSAGSLPILPVPLYVSCCFYFTALPVVSFRCLRMHRSGIIMVECSAASSGKLQAFDNTATGLGAMLTSFPLNKWFMMMQKLTVASAAVGQSELKLFTDWDDLAAVETKNSTATYNTSTGVPTAVRFGVCSNVANQAPFWMSHPQISTVAYPPTMSRNRMAGWGALL